MPVKPARAARMRKDSACTKQNTKSHMLSPSVQRHCAWWAVPCQLSHAKVKRRALPDQHKAHIKTHLWGGRGGGMNVSLVTTG